MLPALFRRAAPSLVKPLLSALLTAGALLIAGCDSKPGDSSGDIELLNVSYDPTREFYKEINVEFTRHWKSQTGQNINVLQSHGGSGRQARSVIDGIPADVVTLALALDIDAIHRERGIVPADWNQKLPQNSSPYASTIVFVVRKGNPKEITDWDDLVRPGIQVITPNPKTGGAPRWCYLAAWAWASRSFNGDEGKVIDFIQRLYRNVPVLDTGARGSTTTFAQRGIGDVLLSWENEAYLIDKELPGQTEIIHPSISILAEPSVAVVEGNTENRGTTRVAKAYLEFLYSDIGQELAGKHFFRPRNQQIAARFSAVFPDINVVTIDDEFGGWPAAQKKHFDDGGIFDQIYKQ